jgi:hypothetical protein
MPKPFITALLWVAAVTTALVQRALPLLIFLCREALTPPQPQLPPGGQPRPITADRLSRLTRRELQQAAGTRSHLSKAALIQRALTRSAA